MNKNIEVPLSLLKLIEQPLFFLSEDLLILDMNTSAEDVFAGKKIHFLQKPISDLFPGVDLKKLKTKEFEIQIGSHSLFWHCIDLKKLQNGTKYLFIGSFINKPKKSSHSNSLQHKSVESIHDSIANLTEILTGQKVDKKKNALDYVKDIYYYMENIIAELPVSVYWMNRECIYLGCSNSLANLINLKSRHDIVGKTYSDLYDEESSIQFKKADKDVMEKGFSLSLEEHLNLPDGSTKIYLSKKVPLRDLEGSIIGMLGISIDITDRKRMIEELKIAKEKAESASRAKSEFIANMGHDIRTPLTGMLGISRYLEEEIEHAGHKEFAKQIHESGEQLLKLLNGVLDLITIDATTEEDIMQESFSIRQLIHDVVQLETPSARSHYLEIREHIDKNVPLYVISDRMKIQRILLNLIGNAIKFTEKGYIEINLKLLDNKDGNLKVYFTVKDTGIGIPEELQDKVFDRFFKVSPSYKGTYKGHGLGLHIAQKYVDLLKGYIEVSSTIGEGTSISFVIPMKIGYSHIVEKEENRKPSQPLTKLHSEGLIPRILLVEDNRAALTALKIMVQKFNVSITTATDAESAFDLIQKQSFNLLITDVGLPGKQGDELSIMIRDYEGKQGKQPMNIVALTGHALNKIDKRCKEVGINEVYQKPITPVELQKIIEPLFFPKRKVVTNINPLNEAYIVDLPQKEQNLFDLSELKVLDPAEGIKCSGNNESLFREIIHFFSQSLPQDLADLQAAYEKGNWEKTQNIAHNIKSGALYAGTIKLKMACQYLERYWKSGQRDFFDQLYQQAVVVIKESIKEMNHWLATH